MKKVLIITYYWPPTGGSGVQRWVKFTKYLPQFGWKPIIYTPENPEMTSVDHSLEQDIPENTVIIKRHITEFYALYRKLMGKKDTTVKEVNPINSQKKTFKQRLMLMLRGNMFIPDPRVTWVVPSVKFLCKYLKDNPVDAIVSTGPPHSMHLIAMKTARKTGIPWVADFRDPWTKMFYFKHLCLSKWAEHKHLKLEQQVLDNANVIVAVSPLVQDDFKAMTSTPVELITNGFDGDDFAQVVEPDGYFNVTHTGLFASDGNPEIIWQALAGKCAQDAEFKKMLRIRLVGKTDPAIIASIQKAGLGKNLVDLGYQSHNIAVREQKNASLLILPLRKEPEYKATLPGKLFEYLASMNPILGIGQTDGAMARIINEAKAGVVFDWDDKTSAVAYINYCWGQFKAPENNEVQGDTPVRPENTDKNAGFDEILAGNDKENAIKRYSRRSTAEAMAKLLDSLL